LRGSFLVLAGFNRQWPDLEALTYFERALL
jgi:hypothetical protein